jgi:5'-AMP-activated protein kinase regulatory beta subunit
MATLKNSSARARLSRKNGTHPANGKKRVNFSLHAPQADQVCLAGSFNDWDPVARPLKSDKQGTWKTWLNLPPGQYEYRFVVNGQWQEDPSAQERRANPFGSYNSVLSV